MRNGLFSVHFTVSLEWAGIEKVKIDIKTDWEQVKELAKEIDYLAIQDILGFPSVGTEFI
jgi:hypothetical protein